MTVAVSDVAFRALRAARQGREDEAEAAYREWMSMDPSDPRPAYGLSLILLLRGEYAEGFRLYEARAYVPETGVTKPGYRREPLPLPADLDPAWACQTVLVDTSASRTASRE